MAKHRGIPLTPILDVSVTRPAPREPLLEPPVRLEPGKEHKVDGVLSIRNATSGVDRGRRGVAVRLGSEEFPLLEESVFFGKDECVSLGYGRIKITVEGCEGDGIILRIGF